MNWNRGLKLFMIEFLENFSSKTSKILTILKRSIRANVQDGATEEIRKNPYIFSNVKLKQLC